MEAVGHPHLTPSFVTPLASEELHCFSPAEEKTAGITESMKILEHQRKGGGAIVFRDNPGV